MSPQLRRIWHQPIASSLMSCSYKDFSPSQRIDLSTTSVWLFREMCVFLSWRESGNVRALMHVCVCVCIHVSDGVFILRSPMGEECHNCAQVHNLAGPRWVASLGWATPSKIFTTTPLLHHPSTSFTTNTINNTPQPLWRFQLRDPCWKGLNDTISSLDSGCFPYRNHQIITKKTHSTFGVFFPSCSVNIDWLCLTDLFCPIRFKERRWMHWSRNRTGLPATVYSLSSRMHGLGSGNASIMQHPRPCWSNRDLLRKNFLSSFPLKRTQTHERVTFFFINYTQKASQAPNETFGDDRAVIT